MQHSCIVFTWHLECTSSTRESFFSSHCCQTELGSGWMCVWARNGKTTSKCCKWRHFFLLLISAVWSSSVTLHDLITSPSPDHISRAGLRHYAPNKSYSHIRSSREDPAATLNPIDEWESNVLVNNLLLMPPAVDPSLIGQTQGNG